MENKDEKNKNLLTKNLKQAKCFNFRNCQEDITMYYKNSNMQNFIQTIKFFLKFSI